MSRDLRIVNLNKSKHSKHPLPYTFLPNPSACFRMCIIGPSYSGKGVALRNLIAPSTPTGKFGYYEYYDNGNDIFVVSSTLEEDTTYKDLKLGKHNKMVTFDHDLIEQILEYSKKKSKNGTLLILDDMINDQTAFSRHKPSIIDDIFIRGRHKRMSIIVLSQFVKGLTTRMRANSTHIMCFKLSNKTEKKNFLEDQHDFEDIEEMYHYATREQYGFLYLNKPQGRAFRCFEEEL